MCEIYSGAKLADNPLTFEKIYASAKLEDDLISFLDRFAMGAEQDLEIQSISTVLFTNVMFTISVISTDIIKYVFFRSRIYCLQNIQAYNLNTFLLLLYYVW